MNFYRSEITSRNIDLFITTPLLILIIIIILIPWIIVKW